MKALRILAILIAVVFGASAFAACPVEKTTVFYENGVGVRESDVNISSKKLGDALSENPSVTSDCVSVKPLYSYSSALAFDLFEAGTQKAIETGRSVLDYVRAIVRLDNAAWLDSTLERLAVFGGFQTFLIENQIAEHMQAFRDESQTSGRFILVGHSQGNYYANEEWNRMSPEAKQIVHLVAIATPTAFVADAGPHTTLKQDLFAAVFVSFGALPANVSNQGTECEGSVIDWWFCHGIDTSYLKGKNSRTKIVNDIVALLPKAPRGAILEGYILLWPSGERVSGASVTLLCPNPLVQGTRYSTTSGADGSYRFTGVAPDSGCYLSADRGNEGGEIELTIPSEGTFHADLEIGPQSSN